MKRLVLGLFLMLASCKGCNGSTSTKSAGTVVDKGVEVKTRKSTPEGWGGLVTNVGRLPIKSLTITVGGEAKRVAGEGAPLPMLPPGYGVFVEIPKSGEVAVTTAESVPETEPFPRFKDIKIAWEVPLPENVSFTVQQQEGCGTRLGKDGAPATFQCTLGIRHTGTRAARDLKVRYRAPRSNDVFEMSPTTDDMNIEPGDALVLYAPPVEVKKPDQLLLTGQAKAAP